MGHTALPVLQMAAPRVRPRGGPRPLDLVWLELTGHCNLRCAQCYTSSSPSTPHRSLPTARWLRLIDEIAQAGGRLVQLTGGEPTTHPDLLALASRGVEAGIGVEVYTNGTRLDAPTLDRFAELGVSVALSLHSHLPAVHDAITRTPGSHAAAVGAIRGIVRRGLDLRVEAVLMAENAGHGPALEAFVRGLGVLRPLGLDAVRPTGRGRSADPPLETASCTACESRTFDAHHAPGGPLSTCWDGKLAISPTGDVFPCIFARSARVGNVADGPLAGVLAGEALLGLWSLTVDDVEACAGCEHKASCFDCRALPLMSLGDVTAKNPRCDHVPAAQRARPEATVWRRPPGLFEATCAGEVVVLDPTGGGLHRLNETAASILARLGAGATEETVAAGIAEAYEVPVGEVRADVAEAREELARAGLLVPGEGGESAPEPRAASAADPTVAPDLRAVPGLTVARDLRPVSGPAVASDPAVAPDLEPTPVHAVLACAGVDLALSCDAAAWDLVAPLVGPLVVPGPEAGAAQRHLSIVSRRSAPHLTPLHHLLLDGRFLDAVRYPAGLRSALEHALCEEAAAEAGGGLLRLHAAAVSGPAGVAVIPGASGSGKSLLALHGVAAGCGYLSDEVATVGPDGAVQPFPKAVTVKGTGLHLVPEACRQRLLAPDMDHHGWPGWIPLEGAPAGALAAVVIPSLAPVEGGACRLHPAEAAEALIAASFDLGRRPSSEVFAALCALAEAVPAWRLHTGDLSRAGGWLARTLGC